MTMRAAMLDWKARQAGDGPSVAKADPREERPAPEVITRLPGNRPRYCSGGLYLAGREANGAPSVKAQPKCQGTAETRVLEGVEYQAAQCAQCERREREVREALRDWAKRSDEPRRSGRDRYT